MIGLYYCAKQKMVSMPQWLITGKPMSQYTSYTAVFCPLHSSISIEQHEKHLCNSSSHYGKYGRFTREVRPISQCVNASISAILNSIHNHNSCEKCLVLKPLCANCKLSPIHGCEERMGGTKGFKGTP